MTNKEKCINYLVGKGMFESQAEEVFQRALPLMEQGSEIRWDEDADHYPPTLFAIWRMILDKKALEWIDENLPRAFYRPMFTPDPEAEIARLMKERAGG